MSIKYYDKEVFTLAEVSKKLGYTYEELFKMMKDDDIKSIKINNLLYVDINDFIRTCITCGKPIAKGYRFFCNKECEINSKKSLRRKLENGEKEKEKLHG